MKFNTEVSPSTTPAPARESTAKHTVPLQGKMNDEEYRQILIDRIEKIDETKREIRALIHQTGIEARERGEFMDQRWLRRAKDKINNLTHERDDLRKVLHEVNDRIKQKRRATHGQPGLELAQEFVRVAKYHLPEDQFEKLLHESSVRLAEKETARTEMAEEKKKSAL